MPQADTTPFYLLRDCDVFEVFEKESVWPTHEQPFDQLSETVISAIYPGHAQQVKADLAQHLPALNLTLAEQTLLQLNCK